MKVTNEKTEDRQAFLTVEMEPSEMEDSLDSAYRRLVKRARIPGFRTGKAPRAILERYVGKESLLEEALNKLVPDAYNKAIKEQEIEAFAQPQIEITQTEPLIFTAKVPLRPVVTLGDYQSIKVKQEPAKVTDSDVDNLIAFITQLNNDIINVLVKSVSMNISPSGNDKAATASIEIAVYACEEK